jgi:RNA polymerase sigma-70 factor (ECF subfamily)
MWRLWITVPHGASATGPPTGGPRDSRPEDRVTRASAQGPASPRGGTVRRVLDPEERVRAFEDEALPHLDRLYAAALRYVRRPADADDLVQDALATAFRAYHQVEEGSNVRAWLYRVLHTTFLSQYRRDGRRPVEDSTGDVEAAVSGSVTAGARGSTPSAESAALSAIGPIEIRDALAALPEEQRVAVYLADVEGFAYREIADIMGSPVGTVMSRLHRGRAALRAALSDYARRQGLLVTDGSAEQEEHA